MSPSVYITVRLVKTGRRFVVRYRLGGRDSKLQHAGSFKTRKLAQARRDFVTAEIAAGRDPAVALRALKHPPVQRTLAQVYDEWLASRVDVDKRTIDNYGFQWKRLAPTFEGLAPDEVTPQMVQQWINAASSGERPLTPKSVRTYMGVLMMLLDHADIEPNPVRHHSIRYPVAERKIPTPPTDKHVLAILDHLPVERRLIFAFMEQTGARIGETLALTWTDVDLDSGQVLARPEAVKGRRGRRRPKWIQTPGWLLDILQERTPPDARTGRLFKWPHDVDHPQQKVEKAMKNACATAGIPHFHPHDLRHRRISLWHGQGIPQAQIRDRVGHADLAMLNVYAHVMPLDEVGADDYRKALA